MTEPERIRVVDLTPPDVIRRRKARERALGWAKRLSVAALAFVSVFAALYKIESGKDTELSRLSAQYGALERNLERAQSLIEERERLAENRKAISLLRSERTAGRVLQVLAETLPPEAYLKSLEIQRCPVADPGPEPSAEADACSATMTVRGTAPSHKEVGRTIKNMIASGEFYEVALVSSHSTEEAGRRGSVEFEIMCVMAGEGSSRPDGGYGTLEPEGGSE